MSTGPTPILDPAPFLSPSFEITEPMVQQILSVIDKGLTSGLGVPVPGKMCVEAAVCYALGLPHSSDPGCVAEPVRWFKIDLNDSALWKSPQSRANGLRALAIAQLGSSSIDASAFSQLVREGVVKTVLSEMIRSLAKVDECKEYRTDLVAAADGCKNSPGWESTRYASVLLSRMESISVTGMYVMSAISCARSAVNRAYVSYQRIGPKSVDSGIGALAVIGAANAANFLGNESGAAERILLSGAEIALNALKELKSPGCEFLHLLDK